MAERHELTTEERRRGAYAAAEAKRRKKRAVEQRVVELRAIAKVDRHNNWSRPIHPPRAEKEERERSEPPTTAERPPTYPPELRCPHGVCFLDCEWCGGPR